MPPLDRAALLSSEGLVLQRKDGFIAQSLELSREPETKAHQDLVGRSDDVFANAAQFTEYHERGTDGVPDQQSAAA